MGKPGHGIVGVGGQICGMSAVHIQGSGVAGTDDGVIGGKPPRCDAVGLTIGRRCVVCPQTGPVVVGAVEHVLLRVLIHQPHTVHGGDGAVHHAVGGTNEAGDVVMGIVVACRRLVGAAFGGQQTGDVDVGILGGEPVHRVGIGAGAGGVGIKILHAVVAAYQHRIGVVGGGVVVIVPAVGLRDHGCRVGRGGRVSLAGRDVPLSGGNDLLAADSTYAIAAHVVSQCGTDDGAADGAALRLCAGGRAARGMGQLGRQLRAAPLAELGCAAGGLRPRLMAQCLGHHLAAFGADFRFRTGGGGCGYMFMAAGQRCGHHQQRRRQQNQFFHGILPFSSEGGHLSITMHDYSEQDKFLQVISVNFPKTILLLSLNRLTSF